MKGVRLRPKLQLMIICVSLNPAIDRRLRVERLKIGAVNRASEVLPTAGGKAAHVAMAARALGAEAVWLGFSGGATGAELERGLLGCGVRVAAMETRAATRENLEIIDAQGRVTEVLEPGGAVEADELAAFRQTFGNLLNNPKGAQVVLSGSLPPGAPHGFYAELIKTAREAGCRVLLDTSHEALRAGLAAGPDVVKPNRDEAAWLWGRRITNGAATLRAARHCLAAGAREVALTLGGQGVLWLSGNCEPLWAVPPQVKVVSTVGCGDATLAGFAVGHELSLSPEETLRLATACGAANCRAALPGQIDAEEVKRLLPLVKVKGQP
jgi:1-phosphofructokinase family hexose kinase